MSEIGAANSDSPGAPEEPAGPAPSPAGPTLATAPRFCNRCGYPLDPALPTCQRCQAQEVAPGQARPQAAGREKSPVRTALILYFILLSAILAGAASIIWGGVSAAKCEIMLTAAFAAVALAAFALNRHTVTPALVRTGRWQWYPLTAAIGVATCAIAVAYVQLLIRPTRVQYIYMSKTFLEAGYGWSTVMLVVCIAPPLTEELMFRGVILPGLQGVMGVRDAVIVSSAMFMTLHLTVFSFPLLFALGVILAILRLRSGSLYPPILLHFAHNSLVVLAEAWGL